LQLSTFQQDNKKNYEINLEFNIEAKWRNGEVAKVTESRSQEITNVSGNTRQRDFTKNRVMSNAGKWMSSYAVIIKWLNG
jgi:hypothetical protein